MAALIIFNAIVVLILIYLGSDKNIESRTEREEKILREANKKKE
jgi:hypothetical protein